MKNMLSVMFVSLMLSACATAPSAPPLPKSPAQAVFELKTAEAVALTLAVKYKNLPACPTATDVFVSSTPICSSVKVVDKIDQADKLARIAVDNAETGVRLKSLDVNTLVTVATKAVADLQIALSNAGVR